MSIFGRSCCMYLRHLSCVFYQPILELQGDFRTGQPHSARFLSGEDCSLIGAVWTVGESEQGVWSRMTLGEVEGVPTAEISTKMLSCWWSTSPMRGKVVDIIPSSIAWRPRKNLSDSSVTIFLLYDCNLS